MIDVVPLTVKVVAGVPPKLTAVAPSKCAPVSVTDVPPAAVPVFGLTVAMPGGHSVASGRQDGFEEVVGPPVPTMVAEMPSACGVACGSKHVVATSPGPMSVAVVKTAAL